MIHRCHCQFIPPHALDSLARAGVSTARLSVQQSRQSRARRSGRVTAMHQLVRSAAVADQQGAKRILFDCEHTWEQRKSKVLEDGTELTSNDDIANQVFQFAGSVREYFFEVLRRDSIDNAGMDLILNIHYGQDYMNAFWDGDEMTFGDGDGEIFRSFGKSLDVVAHELSHGVTQFTADLEYQGQSGALNEHFSDVFGSAITQYAARQDANSADWLIGDEIMGEKLYGEALRSMKAPGTAYDNELLGVDPQPSHMDHYYEGQDDNGGVHINSGIFNKVFYLVAMTTDTTPAARIWYHALQRLWATAKFADAAQVLVDSARLLTRDGSVPLGSTQTLRSALHEVGIST